MRNKIEAILPNHTIISTDAPNIYIVDYKNLNGGDVEMLTEAPTDIKGVVIKNIRRIEVCFDGFKESSLPISVGEYSRQCECVLFPAACNETDWILFIETKYTYDLKSAFKENHDYPNCMIDQVISTVNYFRQKGIIAKKRRVDAMLSFPKLIDDFSSTFFTGSMSIEDILLEHRIRIRATNSASIISEKRLKLLPKQ